MTDMASHPDRLPRPTRTEAKGAFITRCTAAGGTRSQCSARYDSSQQSSTYSKDKGTDNWDKAADEFNIQ